MWLNKRQFAQVVARLVGRGKPAKPPRHVSHKAMVDRVARIAAWHVERKAECNDAPFTVWVPVHVKNRANGGHGRSHWPVTRERKRIRESTYYHVGGSRPRLPTVVRLIRYGAGTMDEDGLLNSLKSVRDGVADAYGIKDNDPRISFEYDQQPAPQHCHGVRVEFLPASSRRKG